jgi:hypothetical protein|tara:strand:+ start:93 stop:584 length:492 start_codon:yes stop_codon:yes gene_type:complete
MIIYKDFNQELHDCKDKILSLADELEPVKIKANSPSKKWLEYENGRCLGYNITDNTFVRDLLSSYYNNIDKILILDIIGIVDLHKDDMIYQKHILKFKLTGNWNQFYTTDKDNTYYFDNNYNVIGFDNIDVSHGVNFTERFSILFVKGNLKNNIISSFEPIDQ